MDILFAGDLSFDWLPKPSPPALIKGLFRRAVTLHRLSTAELRAPLLTHAQILAQAEQVSRGLRLATANIDHFCVNLECALSDRGRSLDKKRYTMRALPQYVLALREIGITLACLANNHVLDYGPEGLADTTRFLDLAHIQYCGLRLKEGSAQIPAILTAGLERVAVLNFVEREIIDPSPDLYFAHEPCPFPLDPPLALEAVQRTARSMPVVVVLHWGPEWSYLETRAQRELAHALIDAGASAIIGHHTHVAGVVEEYKGRPIAYSLGNLLLHLPPFSTGRAAPRYMIRLRFERGAYHGYEVVTIEPDEAGRPTCPATYEPASLFGDYLLPAVPKSSLRRFDSISEIKDATVTIDRPGVSPETYWTDNYLRDGSIIEGKLPIGPGWRSDQAHWSGIACHRDFLAPEFLSTNLAHTFDDVTLNCRFTVEAPISRLFLIVGQPTLLHNRPKFVCPRLSVRLQDRQLFEFRREHVTTRWAMHELPLEPADARPWDLLVSVEGSKDLFGYLNWRLIGLQ